jgi:hypothetical protein
MLQTLLQLTVSEFLPWLLLPASMADILIGLCPVGSPTGRKQPAAASAAAADKPGSAEHPAQGPKTKAAAPSTPVPGSPHAAEVRFSIIAI